VRLDLQRDVLVLPEVVGPNFADLAPGASKVVFNQNAYLTFSRWLLDPGDASPYRSPDLLGVVCVSEDSRRYLSHALPGVRVDRVHLSVDADVFHPRSKQQAIAVMPRKSALDLGQVVAILRSREELQGWDVDVIQDRTRPEVARALGDATIFLSSGYHEAFPLSILEAMASGCLVVGYDGFGGRELLDATTGMPVPCGDVVAFAERLAEAVRRLDDGDAELLERAERARRRATQEFTPARELDSIRSCWSGVLERAQRRRWSRVLA
jgi:hypothetical protein